MRQISDNRILIPVCLDVVGLWFIHLRAQGPRKGDEHPAWVHLWAWHSITFTAIWHRKL